MFFYATLSFHQVFTTAIVDAAADAIITTRDGAARSDARHKEICER